MKHLNSFQNWLNESDNSGSKGEKLIPPTVFDQMLQWIKTHRDKRAKIQDQNIVFKDTLNDFGSERKVEVELYPSGLLQFAGEYGWMAYSKEVLTLKNLEEAFEDFESGALNFE